MAALGVTNSFVAATTIVASQMNTNFTDIVSWATGTPTLSTSGSITTVGGELNVAELLTLTGQLYLNNASVANQYIVWEGSNADAYETFLKVTEPTADRTVTLPDATGTIALTSDITTPTWNDANNILTNSVFN